MTEVFSTYQVGFLVLLNKQIHNLKLLQEQTNPIKKKKKKNYLIDLKYLLTKI